MRYETYTDICIMYKSYNYINTSPPVNQRWKKKIFHAFFQQLLVIGYQKKAAFSKVIINHKQL